MGDSRAEYSTPTETYDTTSTNCGSGQTIVSYAGSSDGTTFGSYVTKDQISSLNGNRYIRFNVTFDTSVATPACLTGLSLTDTHLLSDFELKGGLACGSTSPRGRGGKGGGNPLGALTDVALIGIAGLFALLPLRRKRADQ